jgi:hypothetical protein
MQQKCSYPGHQKRSCTSEKEIRSATRNVAVATIWISAAAEGWRQLQYLAKEGCLYLGGGNKKPWFVVQFTPAADCFFRAPAPLNSSGEFYSASLHFHPLHTAIKCILTRVFSSFIYTTALH